MKSRNRFKSAMLIIITLFTVIGLTGCSTDDYSVSSNTIPVDATYKADRLAEIENNHIFVITDDKTGVQYIIYSEPFWRGGAGGITPRYNADGTLYIDPEWNGETNEDK